MAKAFYNGTQDELEDGANNLIAIVTPSALAYGVPTATLTSYTTLASDYSAALVLARNPGTRTTVTVEEKNALKKSLKAASIDVARLITATTTVTNAQLIDLRLNPRTSPQPQPVPDTTPSVDVLSVDGRTAEFFIHDVHMGTKRAKAPGAKGAYVYTYVGAVPPTSPRDYHFEGTATRAYFKVQFPDSVANGATIWVTCAWVTGRGMTSNGSAPISFNLPGGAVTGTTAS